MCNSYTGYNLNSYIWIIVIVFNFTLPIHVLYTSIGRPDVSSTYRFLNISLWAKPHTRDKTSTNLNFEICKDKFICLFGWEC